MNEISTASASSLSGDRSLSPAALAHVVLRSAGIAEMRDWYMTVLGAKVAFQNADLCFLHYDDEHHRVAIVRDDRLSNLPRGYLRKLDHVAFSYLGLASLLAVHERLRQVDIVPFWTVNHGPTTSFYYRDPDGNGVELQVDNYDSIEDLHGFFRSSYFEDNPVGIDVDPDDLRYRLENGESERVLLTRADVQST
jgi:catechol 2,3-dioxygenase-like lactoylglutathione lyase family enzyme